MSCFALALLSACGGSRTVAGETDTKATPAVEEAAKPERAANPIAASLHITLEFAVSDKTPPSSSVVLVETNEVGATTRHDLGTYEGECKDATVAVRKSDPEVFLAFHCQPFGNQRGALVQIIRRQGQLILLRAWLGASKPAFDDFDQILDLPRHDLGIPMVTDYD